MDNGLLLILWKINDRFILQNYHLTKIIKQ